MSCHYCPLGSRAGESVGSKQDQNIIKWDWWGIAGTYWSKEVVSTREELVEDSQLGKRKERHLGGKNLWADRVLFAYISCKNLSYPQGVCYTLPGDHFRNPPNLLEEVPPHFTGWAEGSQACCLYCTLAWPGMPLRYKIRSSPLLHDLCVGCIHLAWCVATWQLCLIGDGGKRERGPRLQCSWY